MLGNYDAVACASPEIKESPYAFIASEGQIVMQRCLSTNYFGCSVYANLSLQHWPVHSVCRLCEPDQDGPMCCFSEHLVRDCNDTLYPGGAPGHCDEVPALVLKELHNIIEFCEAGEESNTTRRSSRAGAVSPHIGTIGLETETIGESEGEAWSGDATAEELAWRREREEKERTLRKERETEARKRKEDRHSQWIYGRLDAYTRRSGTND